MPVIVLAREAMADLPEGVHQLPTAAPGRTAGAGQPASEDAFEIDAVAGNGSQCLGPAADAEGLRRRRWRGS